MVDYAIAQVKQDPTVTMIDRNYVLDMLNSQKNHTGVDRKQIQKILAQTQQVTVQAVNDLASQGKIDKKIASRFPDAWRQPPTITLAFS